MLIVPVTPCDCVTEVANMLDEVNVEGSPWAAEDADVADGRADVPIPFQGESSLDVNA